MALGHWLKDYIGPNSANSGGGTVEVSKIKIATAQSGFTAFGENSSLFRLSGDFSADGATISATLDGKQVIGWSFKATRSDNSQVRWSDCGSVVGNGGTVDLINEPEKIANIRQLSFEAVYGSWARPEAGASVEIYAICI